MASTQNMTYRRDGSEGILTLSGPIDIFVAVDLHKLALCALADAEAHSIRIELMEAERLDVAALQVLCALKSDIVAAGRDFSAAGMQPELTEQVALIGVEL